MYIDILYYYLLSADHCACDEHTSLSKNGNIRIELKFDRAFTDPLTCLLYLEYDSTIRIDKLRNNRFIKKWTPCKFTVTYRNYFRSSVSILPTYCRILLRQSVLQS
jgi:hypothetical protein